MGIVTTPVVTPTMTHPHAMFDDVLKRVDLYLSSRARENIARGQDTAENSLSLVFSAGAPLWTAYNRYLIKYMA